MIRVIARPMLASMFLLGGVNALRNAPLMAAKAEPIARRTSVSATTLVRANAAVHVVAGLGLATGRFPRTSAAVLAATMPATTAVGHQFWNETDPVMRQNQLIHFTKNISMTGGLLMATALRRTKREKKTGSVSVA